MKISAIIPTIHRPHLQTTLESLKECDEVITIYDTSVCPIDRANRLKNTWTGDFLLGINDRSWLSPGWRNEVEECFRKINYHGIVNFNTNTVMNGVISRSFFDRYYLGYLAWPEYIRYFWDQELGHRARMEHCYIQTKGGILHTIDRDGSGGFPTPQAQVDWDKKIYYAREKINFQPQYVCDMKERNKLANMDIFKI